MEYELMVGWTQISKQRPTGKLVRLRFLSDCACAGAPDGVVEESERLLGDSIRCRRMARSTAGGETGASGSVAAAVDVWIEELGLKSPSKVAVANWLMQNRHATPSRDGVGILVDPHERLMTALEVRG